MGIKDDPRYQKYLDSLKNQDICLKTKEVKPEINLIKRELVEWNSEEQLFIDWFLSIFDDLPTDRYVLTQDYQLCSPEIKYASLRKSIELGRCCFKVLSGEFFFDLRELKIITDARGDLKKIIKGEPLKLKAPI